VAAKHGFELFFDVDKGPPKIDRYDQREQSDIDMLVELGDRYGLVVRISDKTIVIQEGLKQDKQAPSFTFERASGEILRSPFFRIDSSDIYTACKVQYIDPNSRLLIAHTHEPGASEWSGQKPPSGYVLKVNRRCKDKAEAEVMAKAALREANKREVTGTIGSLGNPDIRAGLTARIKGWGKLDSAPYFVETVRHRFDKQGGYETTAEIRGVIDY
jgi:phage protein D